MGLQSSRIIWGKRTDKDADLTPITLYDPDYTIYTYDNQCIFENKLYKCITAETGGAYFSTEEWKEIKGVTIFSTTKSYKVGAICIYGDYVYRCIQPVIYTNYDPVVRYPDQYPDYWAQQNQATGLVYSPRDHKDVYYDNGRNAVKWHRMMYYIPPENVINLDLPISLYVSDGEYMYKKDDYCLGYDIHNQIGLYKCRANIPIHEEWNPSHWDRIDDVELFDPVVAYNKGDEVIYLLNEMVSQYVSTFRQDLYYSAGQYILDVIQRKVEGSGGEEYGDDYENLFDQAYVNRIDGGETIYGCFVLTQDIPANSSSYFDHDMATLLDYKQYDGSSSAPSTIGEKFIQHIEGGWVLSEVVPAPIETGRPFDYKPIEQLHRQFDTYYLFRSIKDQHAGYFKRDEWIMEYQNYDTQWEQGYGVIWQKLGNPGSAGRPFYYPYALAFQHGSVTPVMNIHTRLGSFFPYLGNNKCDPNELVMIMGTYNSSTGRYVCSQYGCGDLIVANKLQTFCYMHNYYLKAVLSLVKFSNNWAVLELQREADPKFGIVPTDNGFLYVSDTEQTPGYYDIYKAILNAESSAILNESFAFTVSVLRPPIDGEIGTLEQIGRYNGFFESKMCYKDTYNIPSDDEFGWQNDPYGFIHSIGPRQYNYLSVIFEDGSAQTLDKDYYTHENEAMALSRSSGRYLLNDLMDDVKVEENVVRYMAYADKNAVIAACNYWGIPYTIDEFDQITSRIPYLSVDFSGESFYIVWKLCNKEGTTFYCIVNYNLTFKNTSNVTKRFICTVILSLNKYGANDTKIVFKEVYDNNSYTPPDSLTPFYLYNQDESFVYCLTSDYKLAQINLQTGAYIFNGQLSDRYLIKNIPYYNNDTFHSYRGDTYYDIKKANILLVTGDNDDYKENNIRTIYNAEDETIDILWGIGEARKAYLNAYCDSNSGSPVLGNGVFITGNTSPTNLSPPYNIAVYIPNFKKNPTNAGAFFWFSSLGWYGHPCYGGEDEDGFEGW